ncbi:MAG: hypothetical protein M3P49_11945 [Actinomycetota bacterium]|nr:hypothetical protein [Actinomycetota bacterium]
MDVSNGNGEYRRFSRASWVELLELAEEYGWQPAGTELVGWDPVGPMTSPDYPDAALIEQIESVFWGGNYTSNDGQLVTARDADAIADALERAFADRHDYPTFWGEELIEYFRAGALRIF